MPKYFNEDDDEDTLQAKCALLGMSVYFNQSSQWCIVREDMHVFFFRVIDCYHPYHHSTNKKHAMQSALLAYENGIERYSRG